MTPEIAVALTDRSHNIRVRTKSGGLRVAAVWQVLMPVAREVERVRFMTGGEPGFEAVTISFSNTFSGSLTLLLGRFEEMTWVVAAELC